MDYVRDETNLKNPPPLLFLSPTSFRITQKKNGVMEILLAAFVKAAILNCYGMMH